jgi:hypothetical protein
MRENEIGSLWLHITHSVDRILSCLDELNEDDLNWRPIESANSLYVLVTHMMGNIEANILGVLYHERIDRHRENEFKAHGNDAGPLKKRWRKLRDVISTHLEKLPPDALDREYLHPRRGCITGRELLIMIARHAAEHVGHAELTRDLLFTARGRELPKRDF